MGSFIQKMIRVKGEGISVSTWWVVRLEDLRAGNLVCLKGSEGRASMLRSRGDLGPAHAQQITDQRTELGPLYDPDPGFVFHLT